MSTALRIAHGAFGRVALLDMDRSLVRHAHHHCHVLLKVEGTDTQFLVGDRVTPLTDTAAVLAALDSFTVCRAHTLELNATAIITMLDSGVGHALISWPGGNAPAYDGMLARLTQTYGEPFHTSYGVPFWSADSMDIYLTTRSSYDEGTTLTLSDAHSCERFERMVHKVMQGARVTTGPAQLLLEFLRWGRLGLAAAGAP